MAHGYLVPTNGFTVEYWYLRDALPPGGFFEHTYVQGNQAPGGWGGTGRQLLISVNSSGAWHFMMAQESGTQIESWVDPSPSGYANDNQWHHFALRLAADKITWTVFHDGEVLDTGTTSAAWNVTTGVGVIATEASVHRGVYGTPWNGRLAYFAIYNTALTNNRIFEHYTAGNGGTVYYGDDEVERLTRILDWADVPQQSRFLEAPVTTLQGIEVAGSNALEKAQETTDASIGVLFADGQTRIVYHNRKHRYNRWVKATISETLGSAPETDFEFVVDDTWVFNDIRASRPFGATVRLVDELSKTEYGRKVYSFSLPLTSPTELRNVASWFLARYGDARPRVSGVKVNAVGSDMIEFISTGGLQIGDTLAIEDLDAAKAPSSRMEFTVEGINIDADFVNQSWNVTFDLSPRELNNVFQIGVSTLGDGSFVAL